MTDNDSAMFKWIIPNFWDQPKRAIESKCFTMTKNKHITCCSQLHPTSSDYIPFQLIINKDDTDTCKYKRIMLTVSVSCLNSLNEKVFTHTKKCSGLESCCINIVTINKYELLHYLDAESLILFYEIELCFLSNIENLQLTEEHEIFIVDKNFRDATLLIGDKKIHVHKGILASRSPVFTTMFTTDMKEAITSEVKITSFDYDVFLEVLRFMYTGKIEEKDQLALEILKAAHFYQINDLIIVCENLLSKSLNIENTLEILKLADECGARTLQNSCVTFINQEFKSFQKSYKLKDLNKTHPHLLLEIIEIL